MSKLTVIVIISWANILVVLSSKVKMEKIFYSIADADNMFDGYIKKFGKEYASKEEYRVRLENFRKSLRKVNKLNGNSPITAYGINQFSDRAQEELEEYTEFINHHYVRKENIIEYVPIGNAPANLDYRKKDFVTAVNKRNHCTHNAFSYVARNGSCPANERLIVNKVTEGKQLKMSSEEALKDALASIGPLSADITSCFDFMAYSGGIFNKPDCSFTNHRTHSVLLMGYGTDGGVNHWIIKNSWNKTWGEQGYGRLERGKNICHISENIHSLC